MGFEMAEQIEDKTEDKPKAKRSYKSTYRNVSSVKLHTDEGILWPGKEYKLEAEVAKQFGDKLVKV